MPHVSAEKMVYKWAKLFKEGQNSVEDEDRPGRPTEVRSPEVIKSVNDLIQSDRRVTVEDIARTYLLGQNAKLSMMTLATQRSAASG